MKILRREQDTIKTQREFREKLESTEILKLLKWITYSATRDSWIGRWIWKKCQQ